MSTALDGNAAAGLLFDAYGAEMTTSVGVCAACGRTGPLAETVVYLRAPGVVLRCRNCSSVLLVIVERGAVKCVDARGVDLRPEQE
jgi:hypothetical protein